MQFRMLLRRPILCGALGVIALLLFLVGVVTSANPLAWYWDRGSSGVLSRGGIGIQSWSLFLSMAYSLSPSAPIGSGREIFSLRIDEFDFTVANQTSFSYAGPDGSESFYGLIRTVDLKIPIVFVCILLMAYPGISLLRGHLRISTRQSLGLCLSCGYDLTSNESGICPECGAPVESRTED